MNEGIFMVVSLHSSGALQLFSSKKNHGELQAITIFHIIYQLTHDFIAQQLPCFLAGRMALSSRCCFLISRTVTASWKY